jgi:YHS domain-containing protein
VVPFNQPGPGFIRPSLQPSGPGVPGPGIQGPAQGGPNPEEQVPFGGQKLCPVTGEELGSMGPPIPVNVKGQTIYVCCKGCVAKVQRDPEAFLAKVAGERGGRGNESGPPGDTETAEAAPMGKPAAKPAAAPAEPFNGQKLCPVMDEELGSMGPPVPVTVKGQTIYVCCKGCVAKVKRNPDRYLAKVAEERKAQKAKRP